MAQIVAYRDEYLPGVISCFKRNFPWTQDYTDAAIAEWLEPLTNYHWGSGHNADQKSDYAKGMVLLDKENHVVGFNGLIISRQIIDGQECICGNLSTTAIDPKYRIQVYSIFNLAHKACDIVSSFTPIEISQKMEEGLFKYRCVDDLGYKFLPIPLIRNRKVKIKIVANSSEIENEDLQQAYDDHKPYGIKCVYITVDGTVCYLFYRVLVLKFRNVKYRCARVLYSSDPALCGRYAKDIIWFVEKKERAILDTDSRFFGGEQINYKFPCFKRPRKRLEKNFKDDEGRFPLGLLYSEQSILKSRYELKAK